MTDSLPDDLRAALGSAYHIEHELGGGGMSRVFLAEERALTRRVVIKVLSPALAAAVSTERFRREVRLAAGLHHAHIVPVLSAGVVGELPYYTMPFVDGESVREHIRRAGALDVAQALRVLTDVSEALAYAHGRGIVHRDIKPGNVLLADGAAFVTDFGIAKALGVAGPELTSQGVVPGSPAYMAPEQIAGGPAADHRADLYSFGVLGYEMLAGESPFAGRAPHALLSAQVLERPRPLRALRADVPGTLEQLLMQCLAKDPKDRPPSAQAVASALHRITAGLLGAPPSGGQTIGVRRGEAAARTPNDRGDVGGARRGPARDHRDAGGVAVSPIRRVPRRSATRAALIVGVALAVGVAAWRAWRARRAPPETLSEALEASGGRPRRGGRVLVATPVNVTGRTELDSLAPALARAVSRRLSASGIVTVVPRDTVERLEREARASATRGEPLLAVLQRSGARVAVTAVYYLSGDTVRIQAGLTRRVSFRGREVPARIGGGRVRLPAGEGLETVNLGTVSAPLTRTYPAVDSLGMSAYHAFIAMTSCGADPRPRARAVPWCWTDDGGVQVAVERIRPRE